MNPHFILDYETIGQDVFKAPVVNCSYYVFDWDRLTSDNPYTFNELIREIKHAKFDVAAQVEQGYKFKREDLEFWQNLGPEVMKQISPSPNDISVESFVHSLYDYVITALNGKKLGRWWSRSNTFDPILLHRNFRDHSTREKLDFILPYWLVRDTRTYIDTQFQFKRMKNAFCPIDDENLWNQYFKEHDSVHDVAADILRLQRLERAINCD